MTGVEIGVLGSLQLTVHGAVVRLGPQLTTLLAALTLEVGRGVPAARLIDLLWGSAARPGMVATLRSHVSHLRRALGAGSPGGSGILTTVGRGPGTGYRLAAEVLLDTHRFERGYAHGADLLAAGRATAAAERLGDALALWRGPAFADIADRSWALPEIGRLDAIHRAARRAFAEALAADGRTGDAIGESVRLVADDPCDEAARRLLVLCLYAEQRVGEAADVCREGLVALRERGMDVSRLDDLLRAVLRRQVPDVDAKRTRTEARPARSSTCPRLLPPDVDCLVGRDAELDQAAQVLRAGRVPAVVVTGPAGVGKTSFATRLAHLLSDQFSDGQLHVDLLGFDHSRVAVDPGAALRDFLYALGIQPGRIPPTGPAQAALLRQLLSGRRVLIFIDNAANSAQARPLLPGVPGCVAIVTSRDQLVALTARDGAHPVSLGMLDQHSARRLLVERLGATRVSAEPAAVAEIADACARLPLALSIAAARAILRPRLRLASLAAEMRTGHDALNTLSALDPAADLRAVFSWSYQALPSASARMFRLLGAHPGPEIGVAAAASLAGVDADQARGQLGGLTEAHLAADHHHGRFACHDLLRAYATELAHTTGDGPAATRRVLDHYVRSAYAAALRLDPGRRTTGLPAKHPDVKPEEFTDYEAALAWFQTEYRVLRTAAEYAAAHGFDRHAAMLAWALQSFFDRTGRRRDWLDTQNLAVRCARRTGDRTLEARARTGAAWVNAVLGRPARAHRQLRRAYRLYAELGDVDGQAYVHLCLGWVLEPRQHHRQALHHAGIALNLYRRCGDKEREAMALNNMGWYHAQLGMYADGLLLCEAALRLFQAAGNRSWQARTWDSLGYIHHHLGRPDTAAACYGHALNLFRQLDNRPYQTKVLSRLATAREAAGDHTGAGDARRAANRLLAEMTA